MLRMLSIKNVPLFKEPSLPRLKQIQYNLSSVCALAVNSTKYANAQADGFLDSAAQNPFQSGIISRTL